ncbi:DUF1684 domain-containing protein [Maribacter sp. 2210JD10-5]|uniref:DUF1684 domain-containing protein n=1 Tax=Maribacter sp. 2210JD10-5 TaxID=3386272 RepID=UPI0039BC690E
MKFFKRILIIGFLVFNACKGEKKYHDLKSETIPIVKDNRISDIIAFQEKLSEEFKDPDISPLPDRYRKNFESLDFFVPDTNYVVKAKFVRTPEAVPFFMPTTTDRKSKEVVFGKAYFQLNGKKFSLEIYQNPELILEEEYKDYLFLPFTDNTNGEETYGGGRYLDLTIPDSDTIVLDFNKAYNPYCVYNKKYSCPLVPSVNHLNTKIMAGVKAFKKDYN